CREYHGEATGDAERHEGPDEKEAPGRRGDRGSEPVVSMDDGHAQRCEPAEEHDDVPRSPLGEQQRSARHEEQDGHHDEYEPRPSPVEPEDDVAADVKWQEYDREQRCDGQCVGLHWCPRGAGGGWRHIVVPYGRVSALRSAPTLGLPEGISVFNDRSPLELLTSCEHHMGCGGSRQMGGAFI